MSEKERENEIPAGEEPDEVVDVEEADDEVEEVDPVEALQSEIEALQGDLAHERDKLLRTVAEMDNLRKRTRREVIDARRFSQADLLRPLLDVLDNFERALQHAPAAEDDAEDAGAFRRGVEMIAHSFRQTLLDRGVRPIEVEGREFDPSLHEAVAQQPAPEGTESGTIMAEVQTGYTLDDLVLRASRVVVAK